MAGSSSTSCRRGSYEHPYADIEIVYSPDRWFKLPAAVKSLPGSTILTFTSGPRVSTYIRRAYQTELLTVHLDVHGTALVRDRNEGFLVHAYPFLHFRRGREDREGLQVRCCRLSEPWT